MTTAVFFTSCGSSAKVQSANIDGVYSGIVPCADCQGILTSLEVNKNDYVLRTKYLGKNDDQVYEQKGRLTWNKLGNVITLEGLDAKTAAQYAVKNNALLQLDLSGKEIEGGLANNYILYKVDQNSITEKYWRLVEFNGKAVGDMRREPNIVLRIEGNLITGHTGCNGFSGTYTLNEETKRISFSQMIATKMACLNMEMNEQDFFNALNRVDNYSLNGNRLTLNRARMAPLVVFEAVTLQ